MEEAQRQKQSIINQIGGTSHRRNAAESLLQAMENAEHGKVKSY